MIALNTLIYLANQKQKDAKCLLNEGRYAGAVYLMGYALELSFKKKIAQTLGFLKGFPETKVEYASYAARIASFNAVSMGVQLNKLREIRNHKLPTLAIYAGSEARIVASCLGEWTTVQSWNPEDRYRIKRYGRTKAEHFIDSANKIIRLITLI